MSTTGLATGKVEWRHMDPTHQYGIDQASDDLLYLLDLSDDEELTEIVQKREKDKKTSQKLKKKVSPQSVDKKGNKERKSKKRNSKRNSDSLRGSNSHKKKASKRNSDSLGASSYKNKQKPSQRHSTKLPVKKKRNSTKMMDKKSKSSKNIAGGNRNSNSNSKPPPRDTLTPKPAKKKRDEKLKLNRSKSTKVIKESKATKPSAQYKSKRSKSRLNSDSEKNEENINKSNKSKSKKKTSSHTKSKSQFRPKSATHSKADDATNALPAKSISFKLPPKEKKSSRPQKRVTINPRCVGAGDIAKAKATRAHSEKHIASGDPPPSRATRRATRKLIIDKSEQKQEDIEAEDDEDSYEEEEDSGEDSEPQIESFSNITPSLVATTSKASKEDEDRALFKEYDEIKRSQWDLGSQVKVYSNSEKAWLKGKVIKVTRNKFYYEDGEWLKLMYHDKDGNELTKSLPRKDKYLKHSMRLRDFKNEKHRKRALRYMDENREKSKMVRFNGFYIHQKCEYRADKDKERERELEREREKEEGSKSRYKWASICEMYRDSNGSYIGIEYWDHKDGAYKQRMLKGYGWIRATIARKVKPVMVSKWKYLSHRIKQVPDLIEARNVHLNSMADFYSRYEITSYKEIPDAVGMLIQSQNIKLFPILLLDVNNILIPTRFIEFIHREYDSSSRSKLFANLDELCNNKKKYRHKDKRYAQFLGAKMYNVTMRLEFVLKHFTGKMALVYGEDWQDLLCDLPDSAGGTVWRQMYKRYISQNNQNDEFGFYSAKNVLQYEGEEKQNIQDLTLDGARELAMVRFMRAKLMEMEYERLKDDSYYIPVVFAVSGKEEHKSFHTAACNAVRQVFQSFYRVICYELDTEKITQSDRDNADATFLELMLKNRYIEKVFIKAMKHPYIQPFIYNDVSHKSFEKQTWHTLFAQHGVDPSKPLHSIEQIKI